MKCRDCVFFKTWKSFGAAMCEATKKSVDPLEKACENFIPRGVYDEWGEKTGGETCR
jgi:hypothetical protein